MAEDFCYRSTYQWIQTAQVFDTSQSWWLVWLGLNDVEVTLTQKGAIAIGKTATLITDISQELRYQCFRNGCSNTFELSFAYQYLCSLRHSRRSMMPFNQWGTASGWLSLCVIIPHSLDCSKAPPQRTREPKLGYAWGKQILLCIHIVYTCRPWSMYSKNSIGQPWMYCVDKCGR